MLSSLFSTAGGVPGTITEMAESWKIEQTCVTGPSPVVDSSAPCANHEARREWAEKECQMVSSIFESFQKSRNSLFSPILRSLTNPIVIHSHLVSRNLTRRSFDNSTLNVSTMRASMYSCFLPLDTPSYLQFLIVVTPEVIASVCVLLWLHSQKNVNRSMFPSNGVHKTDAVSDGIDLRWS